MVIVNVVDFSVVVATVVVATVVVADDVVVVSGVSLLSVPLLVSTLGNVALLDTFVETGCISSNIVSACCLIKQNTALVKTMCFATHL